MFSIPLLDKFWLNEAKTNPAIDLFELLGQGHSALGLIFMVRGYELIFQSVLTSFRGAGYHLAHRESAEGATGSESAFLNPV